MTITKKITLGLLLVIFISFAFNVFSQGRPVEVKYPVVEGYRPEEVTTLVPEYVRYIFNFFIWLSGFVALVVLIYAGFQYFTSTGNPELISDAKDKIKAALLGLLILFGSYLILFTINPELVVFNLKRLRPIISRLPPGVLVCKEEVEVDRAWQLENNFKYAEEYWQQIEIKKELDTILDKVALRCYSVSGSGDITPHFDNQITDIYFIPAEQTIERQTYAALYGVILYEETNYKGKSQPIYEHLISIGGVNLPVHKKPTDYNLNPSSIKPFVLIPQHRSEAFQVGLFQQYNRNFENKDMVNKWYMVNPENWWCKWDLVVGGVALCAPGGSYPSGNYCSLPEAICGAGFASPRSIQVGGDFLAILLTPDGRSDTFYNEIDNNLDDNLNIVNWVACKDYQSRTTTWKCIIHCCAQPAVKDLIIISAKVL